MQGRSRPVWALPPSPPEAWGARRSLALVVAAACVAVPLLVHPPDDVATGVRTAALVLGGLAGVALTVALRIVHAVSGARRWSDLVPGAAAVAVIALVRGVVGPDAGPDAALALLQWAALALAVLHRLLPVAAVAAAAVVALVPDVADGLVQGSSREPALALLELVLALLATTAALAWSRRSPAAGGWVTAGLAVAVVTAAGRAVLPERDGVGWYVLDVVAVLAAAVPAVGLGLVTCRPYRRQTRRWRQLEAQVRALRASSPLLPGPSVTPEDEEGLPTEAEVRALLARGVVSIALQPVVRLEDGVVVGQEALARFDGRVPTDRWFRGAGYHGLSEELELLTLRAALATLPRLRDGETLAVNLSPLALAHDAVHDELQGVDLSRVVVEITEHEAVRDYAAARAFLDVLRDAGARIAVDDIGAGFASLRHVLQLRPDVVKLDQSLTRGIDHDARQRGLVVALARFAEEIGVELIAEGVETAEQAAALQSLGMELGQGWGLGVPVVQRD